MDYSWLPRAMVPAVIAAVFAVFRKYFPAKIDPTLESYDREEGKRLPTGAFGAITITMGTVIAIGGYFLLRLVNHLFAKVDAPVLLQAFPVSAIWCFFPGFAALAVPWPLTVYLLRHSEYRDDAAYIEAEGSEKSGFDCYRLMAGMVLFIVVPIAFFTMLALPERLSFTEDDVRWTHYASLRPEVYKYADATRATLVDGYFLKDGTFKRQHDFLLDFKDGRRLSANAVGDGGSEPSKEEIEILENKTGLVPQEVHTLSEVH